MPVVIGAVVIAIVVGAIVVVRRRRRRGGALDAFKDRQYEQEWLSTYAADLMRTMFLDFFMKDKTVGEAAIGHLVGCQDGHHRRAAYVLQSFWTFLAADVEKIQATELLFMDYLAKVEQHLHGDSQRRAENFRTRFVRKIPEHGTPPATPIRVEDDWGDPHRFGVYKSRMTNVVSEIHRTNLTTDRQLDAFEALRRVTERR